MKLKVLKYGLIICFAVLTAKISAQVDYFDESHFRYDDFIYDKNIKTVEIYKKGNPLSPPLIMLNSNQKIILEFDDLQRESSTFEYTIYHCDALWNPTDAVQNEYLEGYLSGKIYDFTFSFNTMQAYTHYRLEFPNDDMKLNRSGNYIIVVYPQAYPEQVVLTKRFSVFEDGAKIDAEIVKPSLVKDLNYKQRIFFNIEANSTDIIDPYSNIVVVLKQNGRKDNIISDLQPQLVSGNRLVYEHNSGNEFSGINEYRNFDIKSMKYYSPRLKKIEYRNDAYHVDLLTDKRRPFQVYRSQEDINGRYLIKTDEKEDSDIESEYVWVKFNLAYDAPMIDGNFYILGNLTDWNLDDRSAMSYDFETNSYTKELYLKQGYYNYSYAFLKNGEHQSEVEFAEGQHFETENEYGIYVYYKPPGSTFDRLIGVEWLNSRLD